MFLSWVSGSRPPSRWKPLMASMRTPDIKTRTLRCSECHLDDNQSKNCPQADHTLLLEPHKTPRYALQVGPTVRGLEPTVAPAPGKAIKAPACISPKSVSASIRHQWTEAALQHRKPHSKKGFTNLAPCESQGRVFSDALARWWVLIATIEGQSDILWHHVLLRHTGDSSISSTTFQNVWSEVSHKEMQTKLDQGIFEKAIGLHAEVSVSQSAYSCAHAGQGIIPA